MRCRCLRASPWRCGQFLWAVLCTASPATASPPPPDSGRAAGSPAAQSRADVVRVTWPEIVRLVDRHPRLAASRFQIDATRGAVDAAGAVPNPTLEATVGRGWARVGPGSRFEWSLGLIIPLGWIAQRGSRVAAAEAEVDVAEAESRALRRDILLELRTLFWNLANEQARVASLEQLEVQTSALAQTVNKRVEKGEIRPIDATRVEIELQKVQSELEGARTSLGARQSQLALWLGVPKGKAIMAVADGSALPAVMDLGDAFSRARTTHPALAAARARSQSRAAEVDSEKMARVPNFSLTAFTGYEFDRRTVGVGLAVDLPLWNWNSGRIAQARARLAAGRKQAEAVTLELETTVIEAQAACRASVATAARLKRNVVPRSETAASTMERTYQLGEASLLEVIDARRTLLDVRRLYLSALAEAHIDCNRLGALVGEAVP
jgi:outer membrane protein, heavy metal efflux system